MNYVALSGRVETGDEVLLNTTAQTLHLGTGGYDYVIANLSRSGSPEFGAGERERPHHQGPLPALPAGRPDAGRAGAVRRRLGAQLDGFPVLVGQLHSQIAPAAAALHLSGRDEDRLHDDRPGGPADGVQPTGSGAEGGGAADDTLTCGQAFGGDYETVTLHSALLAAKHILNCDAAIVCQGPGNAGTGTKYGFSGIEQAQNLDIVKALGGTAIAIVRMSSADTRERHQGISHHTRTTLEMAYARCIVPLPAGTDDSALPPGHDVRFVEGAQAALDLLAAKNIHVTTMGRTPAEDPAFFLAAAAAGMVSPLLTRSSLAGSSRFGRTRSRGCRDLF